MIDWETFLLEHGGPSVGRCNIPRRDRALPCPLTYTQRRLWFLEQFNSGMAVNSTVEAVRFRGKLDPELIEQALNILAARHEILRTTFQVIEEQPFAMVHEGSQRWLERIDLSELEPLRRQAELERLLIEQPRRAYRLEAEVGFRATLVCLGPEEYVLIMMMHDIISDLASLGMLWRELSASYRSLRRDEPVCLAPLPIQHGDYAVWQQQQLCEASFAKDLDFWEENLRGVPELLELPSDRARPPRFSHRGARRRYQIDSRLVQTLRNAGRQANADLFITFTAAVNVLLYRYTGSDDIVLGIPLPDRDCQELKSAVGSLLHTHALRTRISGDMTFRELLVRVQTGLADLYAHRAVPFDQVVSKVRPGRNLSHAPLFQVMVDYVGGDQQLTSIGLDGLIVEPLQVETGTSKFDLTFSLINETAEIVLDIEYATDLFDPARIDAMVAHFRTMIEGIAEDPNLRLSKLPLLTEVEERQLLVDWNDTRVAYPPGTLLHQLFERQVEGSPERVAVVFDHKRLTYGELNRRANQLARYLGCLGVGPDQLVGVCMERSLEMVVALYGILKAGGAYVPLDPGYPPERLAFMISDARVPVLLTQSSLLERIRDQTARVVCLDRDWGAIEVGLEENLDVLAAPESLAYCIYTSGSTGRPKGVMIEHRSVVNFANWAQTVFSSAEFSGVLFSTSICFDLSVFELFVTLGCGGTVILAANALALPTLKAAAEVTLVNTVPSAMAELLEMGGLPRSVITVNLAGEPLLAPLVDKIYDQGSVQKVYDLYGPSETTTYSTCSLRTRGGRANVGRPIANTTVYLLDRDLSPVPIGVPGQLHIGGEGLARGYLRQEDLTAEKFIKDPFSSRPGARIYRTGDLARYLPDGNIEYLGRLDHQVKIRGFRVELAEIESVLTGHKAVREAVVVARGEVAGDKRLLAYVTTKAGESIKVADLRGMLQTKLPDYMVPSAFIPLDRMPLSANGKIDRKALPVPELARPELERQFVAPRTPMEAALARIWRELLGLDRIGVYDDFFELGGHSLLASRVVSRLRWEFKMTLPLRSLFETPTIAALACEIDALQRTIDSRLGERGVWSGVPEISALEARPEELPLSFAQERLWFLDRLEPQSALYNIPMALSLSGALDAEALRRCLDEVVRRHEILRTRFQEVSGRLVQVIDEATRVEMPLVDLIGLPDGERETEIRRLRQEEAQRPFNLGLDGMLRSRLVRLGPKEHVLLLTTHHVASDGWSLGVLIRELEALYNAYTKGLRSPLPELPVQYVDYVFWQRGWLQGQEVTRQLSYWRKQLDGVVPLELPSDRVRPTVPTHLGAMETLVFPLSLLKALKALGQEEQASLHMTLLAAFHTILYRYTGQEDIVVGAPVAGRNSTQLEGLIGFFVNTLVMRGDLSGDPTFRELLRRVREVTLGAYAHQDLPFQHLVGELRPDRSPSHSPLFQVVFALESAPAAPEGFDGLHLSLEMLSSGTSKFDLTLFVKEGADGLTATAEYRTELFDAATIRRFLGHYQMLLEGIVANPEQRVSVLPILTQPERYQVLVDWNRTEAEFPKDKCVHELFEEQVARTPNGLALADSRRRLTYRELNDESEGFARRLRESGVGPNTRVGVWLERSVEMVVAMLSVWKAGGAYLPVDPGCPVGRLAFMLRDAQAPVLLTQASLRNRVSAETDGIRLVCVDELLGEEGDLARASCGTIERDEGPGNSVARSVSYPLKPTSHDLAYVIYTSGSTGQPKGVEIEHRSLVNLIGWHNRTYKVVPCDRASQMATPAFDASVWELWPYLAAGASIHIVDDETRLSSRALGTWLQENRITISFMPTPVVEAVLDEPWPARCLLRALLTGGDLLHGGPREGFPCALVNHYGPTEGTVVTTWTPIPHADRHGKTPPIGRPISNTRVYILDRRLQPVPVGVPGELYIGGESLARGYLGRPDLTADKFIPDPFSGKMGQRLYRTGDLVRYLPNGLIEFLGRLDHQVKIRGFRIELGEIEVVLRQHHAVKDALVLVREDVPGNKHLVAYLAPKPGHVLDGSELRASLLEKLPEYMVPSVFVPLERFPLLPNGKVNRKELPAPDFQCRESEMTGAVPFTPTERVLAQIWAEVLGLERVGIHDDFFELGGNSLMAVKLQLQVEKALGRRVPLVGFFQAPTVSRFASLFAAGDAVNQAMPLLFAPPPARAKLPLFCLQFPSSGKNLARHLGSERAVYGIETPLDEELSLWHRHRQLAISIEDMARRCIPMIRRAQPRGPYCLAGFCFGGVVAFEVATRLASEGEEVALLALIDSFYLPGCKPLGLSWIRRWAYHVRQGIVEGPAYVLHKLRWNLSLRKRRRSQLDKLNRSILPPAPADLEGLRLPLADFINQIQNTYTGKPYAGRTLLVRAASGPQSFDLDCGLSNGWHDLLVGQFKVEDVLCEHMQIAEEPYVGDVARVLKAHLNRIERDDARMGEPR